MRASNCIIFLVLLISVSAFPQNAIEFVTETPTIAEENNAENGNEPAIDEKVNNSKTISQDTGIIANETVVPGNAVEGVTSEVVIPTEPRSASEAVIPGASEATSASEIVTSVEPQTASEAVIPVEARSTSEAVITAVPEATSEVVVSEVVIPVEARSANEGQASEAVISVLPEATNEAVASVIPATNGGVASEAVIPVVPEAANEFVIFQDTDTDVNEILVPTAPKKEVATSEAAIVEVLEAVTSEAVVGPSEEVQSKAIPVPSEVPRFAPVEGEVVFSLRSIVPSPTTAAPVIAQDLPEVASLPAITTINSDSTPPAPATTEASVSSVSTPVPETTSVASATEATEGQVSNISAIIFGEESVVPRGSNAPLSDFELAASTNEILGRSVMTNFPDIEVIIPLVDVSVPVISGRSLSFEPVPPTVSDSDITSSSDLAPSTTQVPDVGSVVAAVAEPETPSNDAVVPDSSTGSQNVEVAARALDAEPAATVTASDATVSTATTDSGSNNTCSDIDLVSSTTEGSVLTVNVSEVESIAPTNDATVEVTSTNNEEASETDVASRSLNAESPTSTAEVVVANAESGVPTESVVSSTTAAPDSTDLIPDASVTVPAEATDSVSSTSAPEVPSSNSESVVPREPEVTSSADGSVVVDPTPSPSTESPVSSSTSSLACATVGNFSVPTNCRLYRTCSTDGTGLTLQEYECPEGYAFSSVIRRCSRDISPCGDSEPTCTRSGSIADPNTSSAYYWCAASLLGGYHKYHVQCDTNEVYVSSIARCLPEALHISHKGASDARSDRDIIKAEWKILKKEIKLQAKEDKVRQKMEAKAKAYAEKLATKSVKKQKGDTKKHDDSDEEDDDEDED